MGVFSITRYAAAVRRALLNGLTLNDMLNLKEQHESILFKIPRLPTIKNRSDYFALSFIRSVNIMDKRFLKKETGFSDTFPWKKLFNGFMDDLFSCDAPETLDRIISYYKNALPPWSESPPETLQIGKQGKKYMAAFNFLLNEGHLPVLLENVRILKKYHTKDYSFRFTLQSYIWRCVTKNGQKQYSLDIILSVVPPNETVAMIEHILSRKKLHTFLKFPAVTAFQKKMLGNHADQTNGKGIYHNLTAMMFAIIDQYLPELYENELPVIVWGGKYSVRQIGAFKPGGDLITMSPVFDLPEIPINMIEFVIYHELLHKKLGSVHMNGRDFSHTPEFRKLEAKFKNAGEIDKSINKLFSHPSAHLNL